MRLTFAAEIVLPEQLTLASDAAAEGCEEGLPARCSITPNWCTAACPDAFVLASEGLGLMRLLLLESRDTEHLQLVKGRLH
mmetsp:Transcript_101466/g.327054  ORF Transcript_101466/g.327054 Transcript_101466/m.327054 type:complete len:81 (-) Transcript_101466:1642-1884(-)